MIGQTLGHYRIDSKLGEGGMGLVYRARDLHLDREVAIKVLPTETVADPERKRRFAQEAKAASALNHPNILHIYDISAQDGVDFIAMEYVKGETLAQRIGRKELPLKQTLKYASQIADALTTAHRAGIIHRDIKPSNLIVSDKGVVKVLDFGLAKLIEPTEPNPGSPTESMKADSAPRTEVGTVVGTVAYMSPEQAAGKNVDARSDIFSFGTTLYEMVTGRRPFQGDTKMSTLAAIIHHEPPPPSEFAGALPPELEKIIARCLRKDPERRAQHMDDVKLALEELKEESESGKTATAARQPRSAVFRYVAVAAGAVIAGAAAFWFVANYLQREDAAIYQLRPITRDEARSFNPALSPDGKLLVYSSDRAGGNNVDLWLQQVAGGEPMRLTRHPARETDARFSADGSQIVFVRAGAGVYTIPALGGTERLIVKEGSNPSYSPDGQWIAYTTGYPGSRELYGLFLIPSSGGAPRKVPAALDAFCCPLWSPDGTHLVVVTNEVQPLVGTTHRRDWAIVPREGGAPIRLRAEQHLRGEGFSAFQPVAWVGNPDRLFFSGTRAGRTNIWSVEIDPRKGTLRGKPRRLTAGTGEFPGSPSLDSRIPFSTGTGSMSLYSLGLDAREGKATGESQRVIQAGASEQFPTVTSDGRKMVFASRKLGTLDIWMKDLVTGEESVVVATPDEEPRGVISPDGSRLAFQRVENQRQVNYLFPLPGGPEEKFCEGCGSMLGFSSDGKSVLVSEGEPTRFVLFEIDTGRKTVLAVHPKYPIHDVSLSPDGHWCAFKLVLGAERQPVYVTPVRGGPPAAEQEWIQIAEGHYNYKPFWSPDGKLLYYYSSKDGRNCLYGRRLDGSTKRPVDEEFSVHHFHGDLQPAGGPYVGYGLTANRLYLPMQESKSSVWLAEPEGAPLR